MRAFFSFESGRSGGGGFFRRGFREKLSSQSRFALGTTPVRSLFLLAGFVAGGLVTTDVHAQDTTPPNAVCQDILVPLEPSGSVTITGADVDGGSTDNVGIASLGVSPDTFTAVNLGDNAVTLTVTDTNGNMSTCGATVTVRNPLFDIVVGPESGAAPQVAEFLANSGGGADPAFDFPAYPAGFTGGVRVATGDVNNDGVVDIITGAGPGAGPQVKVFDGVTGIELEDFFAFNPGFTGGVFVAAGDVTGDGLDDIITGADAGGGPQVRVFDATNTTTPLFDFLAFDPAFTGGVRVAAGDVNGDGLADIITGTGSGSLTQVRVFDGTNPSTELESFRAFSPPFSGGVFVGAGDVDGDGLADIITGAGPGSTPLVNVVDARDLTLQGDGTPDSTSVLSSFLAYGAGFTGGVRVATGDVNGDGLADIITGAGPGGGPQVKVFDGNTGLETHNFLAYAPTFTNGIFVGGIPPGPPPPGIDTRVVAIGDQVCVFDVNAETDDTIQIEIVGLNLRITDPANVLGAVGAAVQIDPNTVEIPLAGLNSVCIESGGGDDTLLANWAAGNPQFPAVFYSGGGNNSTDPGDQLVLASIDPITDAVFDFANANDGSVDFDGSVITYTGLEPITSTVTAANVTLNYSAAVDNISVTDGGGGSTTVDSNAAEITTFPNPTTSLTINSGDGADVIDVDAFGAGFAAALTIDGEGDTDTIDLLPDLNLTGDLSLTAEQIDIDGPTTLATAGSQAYNGPVDVLQNVTLTATGAVAMNSSLFLDSSNITFSVGAPSVVQDAVSGTGDLGLVAGTLTLGDSGVVETHNGILQVPAGTLFVNEQTTASANVAGGTLGGGGSIGGAVTLSGGGTIAPGLSPGIISTGDLSGVGTYEFEIEGATPGSGHDQIAVTGTVDLAGSTLSLSGSHVPAVHDSFVLIDNDGADAVTGTFTGFPEGTQFAFNGVTLAITYAGGDGNDVVLFETTISVSNFVWEDLNGNGFQEFGEPGIDGVSVELRTSPGDVLVASDTTAGGGFYLFTGLTPGDYFVRFTPPATPPMSEPYEFTLFRTVALTLNSDIPNEFSQSVEDTNPFTLSIGDNRNDIDAGFFRRVPSIDGFVWLDANGDGLQDVGEPGVPNVNVVLRDVAGVFGTQFTTTNGSGMYTFPPTIPGALRWQVQVSLPIDPPPPGPGITEFTQANAPAGSDTMDLVDSDISIFTGTIFPNSGRAPNLSLQSGQGPEVVDAGMLDVTSPTPTMDCDPVDGGCSPVDTVTHRIDFDEPVQLAVVPPTGLSLTNLTFVSLVPVTAGPFDTEWDLTVQATAPDVLTSVNLLAGAFEDFSSNPSNASSACTFVFDATPPDVICTATAPGLDLTPQTGLTSVSPLVFTVLFNEDVTGVDPLDITVNGPGPTTLNVFPGTGPETSYVLELDVSVAGIYEIGWAAPSADWIEDCAGNDFGGSATTAQTEFIVVGTQVGNRVFASDAFRSDRFGWAVAADAETALIGAPGDDDAGTSSGSVYVFERDSASSMTEIQKIVAPDGTSSSLFGWSVALRGDRAAVGAPQEDEVDSNTGAVYVIDRDPVSRIWGTPTKLLPPPTTARSANVGWDVDVFGDTVVAGAPRGGSVIRGQVIVWERDPCNLVDPWSVATVLSAFDAASFDTFGTSVAIDRQRIIAGAPGDDDFGSNTGSVYSFIRSGGTWITEPGAAKMLPAGAARGDQFGYSVALSGDIAVVGARGDDTGADAAGAVHALERMLLFGWMDVAKMVASDASEESNLGDSVDFDGSTVVAGASDDTANGPSAGAFYSFDAATWTQIDKYLTLDTGDHDDLGFSVGVSGRTIVGGGPHTAFDPEAVATNRVGGAFFHQLP